MQVSEVVTLEVDGQTVMVERLENGTFRKPEYLAGAEREVIGANPNARPNSGRTGGIMGEARGAVFNTQVTAPSTDAARTWDGWGTALKPAWEPIIMAMKPLDGTFANNALTWNVAGLAIDQCRIGTDEDRSRPPRTPNAIYGNGNGTNHTPSESHPQGRWPANLILDEEAAALLDEQSGPSVSRPVKLENIGKSGDGKSKGLFGMGSTVHSAYYEENANVSRFFYVSKASSRERNEGITPVGGGNGVGMRNSNTHPT